MSTWTEADIPDQSGRVHLITGANSGIGFEAARALAEKGATVVLACRNLAKGQEALRQIDERDPAGSTELLHLDLADLDSVDAAAEQFLAAHDRLDVLVNNAGMMATPKGTTAQGFETQFGINHLGHFALTGRLLPVLLATEGSRIVNISSLGHRPGRMKFDDLNSERSYSPWPAYFQTKLANLLFTNELQRRLDAAGSSTIAVAAHPGVSRTNLGEDVSGGVLNSVMNLVRPVTDRVFLQSAQMGALPTLRAAVDPDVRGGDYFGPGWPFETRGHPVRVGMSSAAKNATDMERLWDRSVEMTGVEYAF